MPERRQRGQQQAHGTQAEHERDTATAARAGGIPVCRLPRELSAAAARSVHSMVCHDTEKRKKYINK